MSEQELLDISIKVDHLSERLENLSLRVSEQLDSLSARVDQLAGQLESLRTASSASFQLISSAAPGAPSVASSVGSSHDFNILAAEIPPVPDFVVRLCATLTASRLDFRERASRAWEAGWWAKFCAAGRIAKVRPSKPIELANTCYIIIQAEGFSCPILCQKASDYRAVVGNFQRSSISHGFPSLAEAKAYCYGAGVQFPATTYSWSSNSQA